MKSKINTSDRPATSGTGTEARYETCRVCGQRWNVSAATALPREGYLCPACDKRERRRTSALPDRLRQLRERRGVASYVVSELCGLGRDTLRRYEQGVQTPGAEALAALADYYGVTTDWLLGR